ncbi:glutaredoxin 2 [Cedecea sp. NFIX57]|uniref:glutaredoxin 2 n=1 Tax=Cedecea sp. NFIX57 TaxID=1566286 RepID=UPI000A0E15F2|nr:glutaredoxin 2 [Cedecea sp. NFIX57]SMG28016.1 glutaredoxin 2 [Cedecea sp. NFIX57]
MQLYYYEHCPFCAKVRYFAGLKGIPLNLQVVMADDKETTFRLVGKKVVPVLTQANGQAIAESNEIIHYLDSLNGEPVLTSERQPDTDEWVASLRLFLKNLTYPRFSRTPFAELATPSAYRSYYQKETDAIGNLEEKFAQSEKWIQMLNLKLDELSPLLSHPIGSRQSLSLTDIELFVFLRNASIVKGVIWPENVKHYLKDCATRSQLPLYFDIAI